MSSALPYIPHSRPTLGDEEAQAAAAVVACGHIAEGPQVDAFERELAGFIGVPHAVCVSSGTAALHLALVALGVGPGDEVVIPSFVCSALLNAVTATGASPVIAEIDPETLNLDPQDVERRLTLQTKAVVAPHMFGLPADLDRLLRLGVPLVEDCAQAVGARYCGRPVGSHGRAAIFSFYATKVLATGEGGMVVTGARCLAEAVRDLKTYDQKDDYRLRFNYKMTDIQAAVGRVQLGRLDGFIRRRREIAGRLRAAFQGLSVRLPPDDPDHIYFRFVVDLGADGAAFIRRAHQEGIGCARPVHTPLHRLQHLAGFALTEQAWKQSVSIPIHPSLSESEVGRIIDVVSRLLQTA